MRQTQACIVLGNDLSASLLTEILVHCCQSPPHVFLRLVKSSQPSIFCRTLKTDRNLSATNSPSYNHNQCKCFSCDSTSHVNLLSGRNSQKKRRTYVGLERARETRRHSTVALTHCCYLRNSLKRAERPYSEKWR